MSDLGFLEKLLKGAEVEWKPLGAVAGIKRGNSITKKSIQPGNIPVIAGGRSPAYYHNQSNRTGQTIVVAGSGAYAGFVSWWEKPIFVSDAFSVKPSPGLVPRYCFHWLMSFQERVHNMKSGGGVPHVYPRDVAPLEIPIPCPEEPEKSLAIQGEIVRILDSFTELTAELTAELKGRKKQYNHYRDQLLTFEEGNVEWKVLGDIFDISAGGDAPKEAMSSERTEDFKIPILSNGIGAKSLYGWTNTAKVEQPSLTVSARGTIGWTSYREEPFFPIVRLLVLTPKAGIDLRFAYHFMKTIENSYKVPPSGIPQLTRPMIQGTPFPVPFANDPARSLAEQARIVAILDKFDTLTTSLSEGLPREIELRQKQYEYYRDLLLSFPKPAEGVEA